MTAPAVRGNPQTGSVLFCSTGSWAGDLPEAFLYRAPEHFAYRWSVDGTPIAGASSSIVASSPGSYACQVTASNQAGSGTQSSAPLTVVTAPSNAVTVSSARVTSARAVSLVVLVPGPGTLSATATFAQRTSRFAGRGRRRHRVTRSRTVVYGAATGTAIVPGTFTLIITPTSAALTALRAGRPLNVAIAVAFIRTDGTMSSAAASVTAGAPAQLRRIGRIQRRA